MKAKAKAAQYGIARAIDRETDFYLAPHAPDMDDATFRRLLIAELHDLRFAICESIAINRLIAEDLEESTMKAIKAALKELAEEGDQ